MRGINLNEPPNEEMFRLRKALEALLGRDNKKTDPSEFENYWHLIEECERALGESAPLQQSTA